MWQNKEVKNEISLLGIVYIYTLQEINTNKYRKLTRGKEKNLEKELRRQIQLKLMRFFHHSGSNLGIIPLHI